jgi:hypothetical protein
MPRLYPSLRLGQNGTETYAIHPKIQSDPLAQRISVYRRRSAFPRHEQIVPWLQAG